MGKIIDIKGQKFGKLLALEYAGSDATGRALWKCLCDCGNISVFQGKLLRNGNTRSCGCATKEFANAALMRDLTGMRFGRLTVVSRGEDYVSPGRGRHHVRWNCVCDCGKTSLVSSNQLQRGRTRSCGCLKIGNLKHGGSHDRLYKVYHNMKNRCCNPNSDDYKYYGGRGIKICNEWLESYPLFKEWAYQSGYDDAAAHGQCTIDRIDVNGDYSPDNCRWVSMAVQSRNRRNVINNNDKCSREDTTRTETQLSRISSGD